MWVIERRGKSVRQFASFGHCSLFDNTFNLESQLKDISMLSSPGEQNEKQGDRLWDCSSENKSDWNISHKLYRKLSHGKLKCWTEKVKKNARKDYLLKYFISFGDINIMLNLEQRILSCVMDCSIWFDHFDAVKRKSWVLLHSVF